MGKKIMLVLLGTILVIAGATLIGQSVANYTRKIPLILVGQEVIIKSLNVYHGCTGIVHEPAHKYLIVKLTKCPAYEISTHIYFTTTPDQLKVVK